MGRRLLIILRRRRRVVEFRRLVKLGVLRERLGPLLLGHGLDFGLRLEASLSLGRRRVFPADFGPAPNWTESLAFSALNFGGVGAAPALEVEVLADRVVE